MDTLPGACSAKQSGERFKKEAELLWRFCWGSAQVCEEQKAKYCINDGSNNFRFVRNTAHHYHELAPEVRAALGAKEELGDFWVSRFPYLLTSMHAAMKRFSQDTNCARIKHFYQ